MGAGVEKTRSGVHDDESGVIRVTNMDVLTHGPATGVHDTKYQGKKPRPPPR